VARPVPQPLDLSDEAPEAEPLPLPLDAIVGPAAPARVIQERRAQLIRPSVEPAAPTARTIRIGSAPWPANLPGAIDAELAIAQGEELRGPLAGVTRALIAELAPAERRAAAAKDPLGHAVRLRWKLAVALANRPDAETPVDLNAMDVLLGELGVAVEALMVPAQATEELRAAIATSRAALIRDAVTLSELAAELRPQELRRAARDRRGTRTNSVAEARPAARPADRRTIALVVAFVISAIAAVAFHALSPASPVRQWVPAIEISSGKALTSAGDPGPLLIQTGGKPLSAEDLDEVREEAKRSGRVIHQQVDVLLVLPKDVPFGGR